MGYTHFDKVCGVTGLGVGEKGSEVVVATSAGVLTHSGTAITASAAEINRNNDVSSRLVTLTADTTITEALHEGKTCLLGEVGGNAQLTVTLPEATGSGAKYRFVVSVVNTSNYVIAALTTDTFSGGIVMNDGATCQGFFANGTDDKMTMNGTTTGGVTIGDWVQFEDILDTTWHVTGVISGSGTEATPFAATT